MVGISEERTGETNSRERLVRQRQRSAGRNAASGGTKMGQIGHFGKGPPG